MNCLLRPYNPPMATTPLRLATAEELLERGDELSRCELVRGELREASPASPRSSAIAVRLAVRLFAFVEFSDLGTVFGSEAGFALQRKPDVVRAPDVAFGRKERLPPAAQQEFFLQMAPDLAVKVASPSDRLVDVNEKVHEYLEAGTRRVWVVEPKRERLTVHLPDGASRTFGPGAIVDGGDVLPGFDLRLDDLFKQS